MYQMRVKYLAFQKKNHWLDIAQKECLAQEKKYEELLRRKLKLSSLTLSLKNQNLKIKYQAQQLLDKLSTKLIKLSNEKIHLF